MKHLVWRSSTYFNVLVFFALATMCLSCAKGPGEGGTNSIVGYVEVDDLGLIYPAADEDVYIIYGDDITYGERIKASYDGRFEFNYLREGSYTIYVYSDALPPEPSGTVAVKKTIEISGRKQTVDAGTFLIKKY
ncbi:MAG: hypothetical protein ACO3O0_09490 [Bacteroidia bacterium]|jgi:hypothetical protein